MLILVLLSMMLVLALSVFFIWKGSGWITDSLVPVAHKLGTDYIAITTLLVSFFISVPEIFTAMYSYLRGFLEIGLGVIIGSVIINIGLTVGLSAAIKPLKVEKHITLRDGIYLIVVAIIVLLFGSDLNYTRTEGIALLILFIPYALNVWFFERWISHTERKAKVERIKKSLSLIGSGGQFDLRPSIATFAVGAFMLISGSYMFSGSLINISKALPIPQLAVGILFGGIGTALPNIAAAVQGTIKGYEGAAITETFGSNIFTLLVTLGLITVLKPFSIIAKVFYFDLTWMIIIHMLMISFLFKGYTLHEKSITRIEGVSLVIFYIILIIVSSFIL